MADTDIDGVFLVVRDPELRYVPSGTAVVTLRVKRGDQFYDAKVWEPASWTGGDDDTWPVDAYPNRSQVAIKGRVTERRYKRQDGPDGIAHDITVYAIGSMHVRPRRAPQAAVDPDEVPF